jgi:hypothetical protein
MLLMSQCCWCTQAHRHPVPVTISSFVSTILLTSAFHELLILPF